MTSTSEPKRRVPPDLGFGGAPAAAGVAPALDRGELMAVVDGATGAQEATTTVPRPEATNPSYLEHGGRWFALHASNSVRDNRYLPDILGSRFITHPPYLHYAVAITRPDDRCWAVSRRSRWTTRCT